MEKPCRAHLFSSEYNHHVYAKVSVLAYSFHILLGYEASLLLESLPFFQNCICYSAIFWHYGLRWFTLRPIKSHTCTIGFISGGHGRPLKCVKCLLLPEFSYNASSVWSGIIVHKVCLSANGWLSKWCTMYVLSTLL